MIETVDGRHFLLVEDELEEVDILTKVVGRLGLRDGNGAALHGPAESNLRGGAAVGFCDGLERGDGEESLGLGGHAKGEIGVSTER